MTIVKAKLRSHSTTDGVEVVRDTVPIGTEYYVDLETIQEMDHGIRGHSGEVFQITKRPCILAATRPDFADAGMYILELLDVEQAA